MDAFSCHLKSESLLHISGPDTLTFLQGQTTCDTRELGDERALPGLYCTPQGRVVSDFLLLQLGEQHVALRMRAAVREAAAAVLGKYIIFSKAEIDSNSNDWGCFACWGADAHQVMQDIFGAVPEEQYAAIGGEHFYMVQADADGQAFECFINGTQAPQLAPALAAASSARSEAHWRARQIRSGIARIESATVEEFVPQTLNYDATGHISFTKGCYTGQEVVARLHYRGTPKRRATAVSLPPGGRAEVGDKIFASDADKAVGDVINVAFPEGEDPVALVSATSEGLAAGLHLDNPRGPELRQLPLPYSLATK